MGFKYEITAYISEDGDEITHTISAGDIYKAIWMFEQQYPNALVTKDEMIKE